MFFQIELLILLVMLGVFVACLLLLKIPSGICLMISSLVGMLLGTIFSGTDFSFRFLFEGAFGYLDTILTICVAMICIGAMKTTGILDYFCTKIVKLLGRVPSLLMIVLAVIVMFPAMITGSAICSCITTGLIVLPILTNWGVPKNKAGAFIVSEAVIGAVCPPINIPAMVICDMVDIPFSGFEMPLLAMSIPAAIFIAIILTREYIKPINKDNIGNIVNLDIEKELNFTCLIPLILIILFLVAEIIFPTYLSIFGITLVFAIASVLAFVCGKKVKFFNGFDDTTAVVGSIVDSVKKSFSIMSILMGIGMFMSVFALVGVRGYLAVNCMLMPRFLQIILSTIAFPLLGGISAYGSASIVGPAFVMSFYQRFDPVILVCAFSLLASIGEFLPPSAVSASCMAEELGEKKWHKITKPAIPAMIALFVTGVLYAFIVGKIVIGTSFLGDVVGKMGNWFYIVVMLVLLALFAIALLVYYKVKKPFNKEEKGLDE